MIPALRAKGHYITLFSDHEVLAYFIVYVADEVDVGVVLDLFVVLLRDGEEQLVVFATVEGAGNRIKTELHCSFEGEGVDGHFVFEDADAYVGSFRDVEEFGSKTVGHVDHGSGFYAGLAKLVNDVHAGFGLELAAYEVFVFIETGLHIGIGHEHFLFALQHLEADKGCTQIARYTEDIAVPGTTAVRDLLGHGTTDNGYGYDKAGAG